MTNNKSVKDDPIQDSHSSLKVVGEQYRQELPARLDHLEKLLPEVAAGDNLALEEMITEAHRLRGTARIFGLPKLSDAMVDVEELLVGVSSEITNFRDSAAWLRVDKALCLAKSVVSEATTKTENKTEI